MYIYIYIHIDIYIYIQVFDARCASHQALFLDLVIYTHTETSRHLSEPTKSSPKTDFNPKASPSSTHFDVKLKLFWIKSFFDLSPEAPNFNPFVIQTMALSVILCLGFKASRGRAPDYTFEEPLKTYMHKPFNVNSSASSDWEPVGFVPPRRPKRAKVPSPWF